jgi:hypothetical protein
MKNKKAARVASVSSFLIFFLFLIIGLKAVSKYSYSAKDWHYVAAVIGSILSGCLMLFSIVSLIITFKINKGTNT